MKTLLDHKFIYGGDYNPDQWIDRPDILEEDIRLMKQAHINEVSLNIFAWDMSEPEDGAYDFSWLHETVDRMYEAGICVILATPSGSKSRWLAKKHPEILRMDEKRVRNLYGNRHNHCLTSPVYRNKVREMNKRLAKEFASHPAVMAWHISNEYGGECHCPLCQEAFRGWLRKRYDSIEELNGAWWTGFWNHRYQSFDEVESPSSIGEESIQGLTLDWHRFVSDQTIDFMKHEIAALREGGAAQPVTTNMMYDFDGINYGHMADGLDFISWDSYPLWNKRANIDVAHDTGMQHDYMRSLKKQPFLLMESCPSATNWQSVSKLKQPGLLTISSLQAVAHGADSVQYFQIRQSRGGFEKFHGAVIDSYGKADTRVFREVEKIGEALESLSEIAGSGTDAPVAVLYDVENRWAMENSQGPRNKGMYYHEAAMKSYMAFRKYGLNVDVIDADADLSGYQIVAVPMLYLLRSGIQEKLKNYAADGGTLIVTYWSGVVNETDLCYLGSTPHGLTEVLGLRRQEIDGLYDEEINEALPLAGNSLGLDHSYQCRNLCELVELSDAVPLAVYADDFYAGKAVLCEHSYEKGMAYYIAADMEDKFYEDFYRKLCRKTGLAPLMEGIPEGLEVSSRREGVFEYLFLLNFQDRQLRVNLPEGELIYGCCDDNMLEPYHGLVLKRQCSRLIPKSDSER